MDGSLWHGRHRRCDIGEHGACIAAWPDIRPLRQSDANQGKTCTRVDASAEKAHGPGHFGAACQRDSGGESGRGAVWGSVGQYGVVLGVARSIKKKKTKK